MVSWFRRRKEEPAEEHPTIRAVEAAEPAQVTPPPAALREPDYSNWRSLPLREPAVKPQLAPLVVLGLGPVGEAVVGVLASWLASLGDSEGLALGVIRNEEMPAFDFTLPSAYTRPSPAVERLILPLRHAAGDYSWYHDEVYALERLRGRLAVFQDLQNEPSALWQALQRLLGRGDHPDVWLVGSAFDPEGSGAIFDLAHLVRLVSRAQSYEPFIGLMMALPSAEWGGSYRAGAEAVLRELERLLRPDLPIIHEYNRVSTNYLLGQHQERGGEDASAVLLCEPPRDAYDSAAAEAVLHTMALALLTLAQSAVWPVFGADLRKANPGQGDPNSARVSAFSAHGHYVPLTEIQEAVRGRLARDVLLGAEWGVFRSWRPGQVEPDVDGARAVLRASGYRILSAIADGQLPVSGARDPSRAESVSQDLALALRTALQALVDNSRDNGLLRCEALLTGVEEVLTRARGSADVREDLRQVILSAQQELKSWRSWSRVAIERADAAVARAEETWRRAGARAGWHNAATPGAVAEAYAGLIDKAADIRQEVRRPVRWAWIVSGDSLRLRLDTLLPGFEKIEQTWRHGPTEAGWPALWQGIKQVVTALTEEAVYWPFTLSASATSVPDPATTQKESVTLRHTGRSARFGYVASHDGVWRARGWLNTGVTTSPVDSPWATCGLMLQVYHGIRLQDIECFKEWRKLYDGRRKSANSLHIFRPEQLAAAIEEVAGTKIIEGQTDSLSPVWLSPPTVACMQWPEKSRLFVRAWIAGLVEPAMGAGPYRIMLPDAAGDIRSALLLEASHPLEAMQRFVLGAESPRAFDEVGAVLAGLLAGKGHPDREERLSLVRGWVSSPDLRNAEWCLLVQGVQ